MYLGGYGLGRFLIEGLRTDQLLIPGTTVAVSQVLALCMLIFAVVADVFIRMQMAKGKCQFLQLEKGAYLTEEKPEEKTEE